MLAPLLAIALSAAPAGFQVGRYEGTALNTTANARGKVRFEISSNDPKHVRAFFSAYDGLVGDSALTGTIDGKGVMHLSGDLLQWKMSVEATSAGNAIHAHYELRGANPQAGDFDVRYAGAVQPPATTRVADLAGTWKKEDAFTPPLNPITHLPMGDRFEDGGNLTIDPSGHFQLMHLHNHCDGFGAHCCRLDQVQTAGTLAIDGDTLVFHVASGKQLHHDSCNPAMNGLIEAKAHTEKFRWELQRHPTAGVPGLCWMTGGDWLCFWKS